MPNIAIVTDTDAGLPLGIAESKKIIQVPIIIQMNDESYRDVFDINNEEIFKWIDREKKIPTTAAPSPGQFLETFDKCLKAGADEVLCLTISNEMSATYASACQAADLLPAKRVTVLDTRSLSLGEGYMALAAADAVADGASTQEAIRCAEAIRERIHLFGALSTLKYIAMSGRVGQLAANMAGVLNIKPILTAQNGKLELLEKIRTQKKAWERLIEITQNKTLDRQIEKMSIVNVNAKEDAKTFLSMLQTANLCSTDVKIIDMNPGLAVHTGAGLIAVAFVVGDK